MITRCPYCLASVMVILRVGRHGRPSTAERIVDPSESVRLLGHLSAMSLGGYNVGAVVFSSEKCVDNFLADHVRNCVCIS